MLGSVMQLVSFIKQNVLHNYFDKKGSMNITSFASFPYLKYC